MGTLHIFRWSFLPSLQIFYLSNEFWPLYSIFLPFLPALYFSSSFDHLTGLDRKIRNSFRMTFSRIRNTKLSTLPRMFVDKEKIVTRTQMTDNSLLEWGKTKLKDHLKKRKNRKQNQACLGNKITLFIMGHIMLLKRVSKSPFKVSLSTKRRVSPWWKWSFFAPPRQVVK